MLFGYNTYDLMRHAVSDMQDLEVVGKNLLEKNELIKIKITMGCVHKFVQICTKLHKNMRSKIKMYSYYYILFSGKYTILCFHLCPNCKLVGM